MTVYLESLKMEVYISGAWEDLTPDVIQNIEVSRGIKGNGILDRVASTGTMKFTLRNDKGSSGGVEGYYIPNSSYGKNGWNLGLFVRLVLTYDSTEFTKFYGHISSINVDPDIYKKRVEVTVNDWFDYCATHPIKDLSIGFNKNIGESVQTILTKIPISPLNTTIYTGEETFTSVFDSKNTKALSEFNKLALSEYGYIYLKTNLDGENLVVEGRSVRSADAVPSTVPIPSADSAKEITEAGDYLVTEAGNQIIFSESQSLVIDESMVSTESSFGDKLVTRITVSNKPRRFDSTDRVLFEITSPVEVFAGETKTLVRTGYKDPDNKAESVSGYNMITPVNITDYLMNSKEDGTGTDLTSDLSITTEFFANEFTYVFTNTGASEGYVTKFQVRGRGLYTYDDQKYIAESASGLVLYGDKEITVNQAYHDDIYFASSIANLLLGQYKEPRIAIESIDLLVNTSATMMMTFLYLDIGEMLSIVDGANGVNGKYYINNMGFVIEQGGIIKLNYGLSEALALGTTFWYLGNTGFSELGTSTIIGFL